MPLTKLSKFSLFLTQSYPMASDVLESHMGSWLINVRISELFQTLKMSFDLDKLLYILLNITGTPATLRTVSNALSPPKML